MPVFGILRQHSAENGRTDCTRHQNDDGDQQQDNDDDGSSEHTCNVAESTCLARGDGPTGRQLRDGGTVGGLERSAGPERRGRRE